MIIKVDALGKAVLPTAYRQALHIGEKDEIEIILKINEIVIKKPVFGCVFCGAADRLVRIGVLCVCRFCIERLHNAKDSDMLYPVRID